MVAEKLLSLKDISQQLENRVHVNTIRRWILKGSRGRRLTARMIGGRHFVTQQQLDDFLNSPATAPTGRPPKLTREQLNAKAAAERIFSSSST